MGTAYIMRPVPPITPDQEQLLKGAGAAARNHGLPRGSNPHIKDDPLDAPLWKEWDESWAAMDARIAQLPEPWPLDESASKRQGSPDWYAARGD